MGPHTQRDLLQWGPHVPEQEENDTWGSLKEQFKSFGNIYFSCGELEEIYITHVSTSGHPPGLKSEADLRVH